MKYYYFNPFSKQYYFPEGFGEYPIFQAFYQPYKVTAKLMWRIWLNTPLLRSIFLNNQPENILPLKHINEYIMSDSILAFNFGTKGIEQKISVLGVDKQTKETFFIKYATSEVARRNVYNEGLVLEQLKNLPFVPKIELNVSSNEGYSLIKTSVMHGDKMILQKLDEAKLEILFVISDQSVKSNRKYDNNLKSSFAHGDFCAWNMLIDKGEIKIFDWEMGGQYPLGYDLFTYIFQYEFLINESMQFELIIKNNFDLIHKYFDKFNIVDWIFYLKEFAKLKREIESEKNNNDLKKHYLQLEKFVTNIKKNDIQNFYMHKVVILNKSLLQYRSDLYELLKMELHKNDIELEVIYGKGGNNMVFNKDEIDIDWAKFVPNKTIKIGKTELIWQPCLKYVWNKDLVIVESANKLMINYVLILSRLFSNRKLAYWGHGRNIQDHPKSLRNQFKYLFIRKCDWWFGYTNGTKKFLLSKKYPDGRITVLQNTIDTSGMRKYYSEITDSELQKLRIELDIPEKSLTAIFCGAMYPEKNFDFILEICYRLRKEVPDFNMIFVGSGIQAEKLSKAADANKWIHYVGPKFGNDRVKYFKISQIQLLPYYVGLGIVDSFASETPVITTTNPFHGPEIEYLENGVNGLISKDNIEDYYQTVIDCIRNKTYLNLMEGCKISADKLTMDTMVQNFKNGVISCLNS